VGWDWDVVNYTPDAITASYIAPLLFSSISRRRTEFFCTLDISIESEDSQHSSALEEDDDNGPSSDDGTTHKAKGKQSAGINPYTKTSKIKKPMTARQAVLASVGGSSHIITLGEYCCQPLMPRFLLFARDLQMVGLANIMHGLFLSYCLHSP